MSTSYILIANYEPLIILLSMSVAFCGAYASIALYEQFRMCSKDYQPKILTPATLLFLMSASLGGVTIWCMHFVGMGAFKLLDKDRHLVPISYRLDYTLISLVAVILMCFVGLFISSRDRRFTQDKVDAVNTMIEELKAATIKEIRHLEKKHTFYAKNLLKNPLPLVIAGLFTAGGVCIMHYLGMAAMVIEGHINWNVGIIAASVIIAIAVSTIAFWILFRLLAFFPDIELLHCGCAVIMAVAVNAVHYAGMAAATFVYVKDENATLTATIINYKECFYGSLFAAVIFLQFVYIISIADLRAWYNNLADLTRQLDAVIMLYNKEPNALNSQKFAELYKRLRGIESLSLPNSRDASDIKPISRQTSLRIGKNTQIVPILPGLALDPMPQESQVAGNSEGHLSSVANVNNV